MVSSENFIGEVLKFIKTDLINNIDDPLQGKRSDNSSFVLTSYPQRKVEYPIITIKLVNQTAKRAGMQTNAMDVSIFIEIRIWARNQIEKDSIANKVYKRLRDIQFTQTGSVNNFIYNYNLLSAVEIDESGEGEPKSRILQINYQFYNI